MIDGRRAAEGLGDAVEEDGGFHGFGGEAGCYHARMGQTLEVRVEQDGASSAVGIVRTHRVAIDRPIAKGGTDKGPLGGEYLLVSLGGCFMSNLLAAIRAREAPGVHISNVRIAVTATVEGTPDRVTAMTMTVGGGRRRSRDARKARGNRRTRLHRDQYPQARGSHYRDVRHVNSRSDCVMIGAPARSEAAPRTRAGA